MIRTVLLSTAVFCALNGLPIAPAAAANTRSFVSSSNGSDSNQCTHAAPCRSFQTAYANTIAGGEINTLDPGGYGPLSIDHSISVVSGLGEAGVLVPPGGTGITINAGPNDKINLRGLIVEGAGTGSTGIAFISGGSFTVSNVVVRNNVSSGIAMGPSTDARITISNSLIADNGGHGIYVQPSGAPRVRVVFTRVETSNNHLDGIGIFGNFGAPLIDLSAVCIGCVSSHNQGYGYEAQGSTTNGASCEFVLQGSTGTYNNFEDIKASYAAVVLEQSSGTVFLDSHGSIQTYGDNYISGPLPNSPFFVHLTKN